MSAKRKRTPRDARRRRLGQNFLVDRAVIARVIDAVEVEPDQLIVDVGAGTGALTIPLARAGARVVAIESDPDWERRLRDAVSRAGVADRVRTVVGDFLSTPLPTKPYRVIANPPFALTTALFARLLDDPTHGPWRADILVQYEVARKRAATPPANLRTAAWAPWWSFRLGPKVPRTAFRPVPKVDAALLIVRRRDPEVFPEWLAPKLRELLRPGWNPPRPRARDNKTDWLQ